MATGTFTIDGSISNGTYLGNNGSDAVARTFSGTAGGTRPPSNAGGFSITGVTVTFYPSVTEYATAAYTLNIYLGSSSGDARYCGSYAAYVGNTDSGGGSNYITKNNTGATSRTFTVTGQTLTASACSANETSFYVSVTSSKTGRKLLFKSGHHVTLSVSWSYNTVPATPTFVWPAAASKTTYNSKPYFKMKGTDSDGDKLKYQYKIDSGSWADVATNVTSGTEKSWQPSSAVSAGSHTLYIRTNDGTANSSEASRAFTYTALSNLATDSTITLAQMTNLKTYIDNLAAYYGVTTNAITAPGSDTTIQDTNWTKYAARANDTPNISGLAAPSNEAKAELSYYNGYITKLKSG